MKKNSCKLVKKVKNNFLCCNICKNLFFVFKKFVVTNQVQKKMFIIQGTTFFLFGVSKGDVKWLAHTKNESLTASIM